MAYRKNLTNDQIVPLAMMGGEGETATGNMSTCVIDQPYMSRWYGYMVGAWRTLWIERVQMGKVTHAIYSYNTPIAWFDLNYGWIIPDVIYSATTSSKHQSQLWRTTGRRVAVPDDATPEDMRRVLSGEMVFTSKGYGVNRVFTGTRPGPSYVEA